MRIGLLGKSKMGLVDGQNRKNKFPPPASRFIGEG